MKEEIIYVVNEKDQFVRKATRREVREKALLHRAARVIILNKENKLLVQKRSATKDIHPSMWDIGIAETAKGGDSYESTAMRGLYEELGITGISNIQLMHSVLFKLKYFSLKHNILCKVYLLIYNGRIHVQEEEIDEIKFLTKEEVSNLMRNANFNPVGKIIFNKYIQMGKMIKSIIFDLGGVYFTDGTSKAVKKVSQKYNLNSQEVSDFFAKKLGINTIHFKNTKQLETEIKNAK